MKVSLSKEKILKKIREALSNPVPLPFPKSEGTNSVFQPQNEDLEILFAQEFTKLLGKFAFCVSKADMKLQLQNLIAAKKWGNVYCAEESLLKIISNVAPIAGIYVKWVNPECESSLQKLWIH